MMRRKKEHGIRKVLFLFFFIALLLFGLEEAAYRQYLKMNQVDITKAMHYSVRKKNQMQKDHKTSLKMRAKKGEISFKDYPQKLKDLYKKNPEARQFVLNYPGEKKNIGKNKAIHLEKYTKTHKVPRLLQWDSRWGYEPYAGAYIATSGCGPTCLSMVAIYLTGNPKYNPRWMAEFSKKNAYFMNGHGSKWSLISQGARQLGLQAKGISKNQPNKTIIKKLKEGYPIICVVGPGDFTDTGHFIVMSGYQDGKIKVEDPYSRKNSKKLWNLDRLKSQIKSMWIMSL